MDKAEAQSELTKAICQLRNLEYDDLVSRIDRPKTFTVTADSGIEYQLEVQVFWDGKQRKNICVMVSIDDGGMRAFFPISNDFIMSPNGEFVGE